MAGKPKVNLKDAYKAYSERLQSRNETPKPYNEWVRKSGNKEVAGESGETKKERFVRIADARVKRCLDGLDSVGKLSNTGVYEYSPEQVDCIEEMLEDKVSAILALFNVSSKQENVVNLAGVEEVTDPETAKV